VEKGGRKKYITEMKEEAPENSKESSHSAHTNGMKESINFLHLSLRILRLRI